MKINFNQLLNKAKPYAEKYMPVVLLIGGAIGLVATGIEIATAAPEAKKVVEDFKENRDNLEEAKEDLPEEEVKEQIVNLYKNTGFELVKLYIKPVVTGTMSVAMIFVSHGMLTKQIATLTTACASLDSMYKNYRNNVIEKYGAEEDFRLRNNIKTVEVEEKVEGKKKPVKKEIDVVDPYGLLSPYTRLFDESNPNFRKDPTLNGTFLRAVLKMANEKLCAQGYLFLNDVLDALGYQTCKEGCVVGWIWDPDGVPQQIDFGMRELNRPSVQNFINGYEPVVMLDFNVQGVIYDKLPSFKAI